MSDDPKDFDARKKAEARAHHYMAKGAFTSALMWLEYEAPKEEKTAALLEGNRVCCVPDAPYTANRALMNECMSIMCDETINALEAAHYNINHGLETQRPKERFKYSAAEKEALKAKLLEAIAPTIEQRTETHGLYSLPERYELFKGMFDITLLRLHLGALCEEHNKEYIDKISPNTAVHHTEALREISAKFEDKGYLLVLADSADAVERIAHSCAKQLNDALGSELLTKEDNVRYIGK